MFPKTVWQVLRSANSRSDRLELAARHWARAKHPDMRAQDDPVHPFIRAHRQDVDGAVAQWENG